jgi:hypothetical protein
MKNVFLVLFLTLGIGIGTLSAQTTAAKDTASVNLKDFEGVYKFKETFEKGVVELKGGELFAEIDAYGSNKLLKEAGKDTYKSTSSYGTVFMFQRNVEGKVIGVKLALMGQELAGEKE